MYDVSCKLLSTTYIKSKIGQDVEENIEIEVPISKVEYVGTNEFYSANENGLKPSLQIRINSLNYNNEEKLIYMNTIYSVIRAKNISVDEVLLICERKEANG